MRSFVGSDFDRDLALTFIRSAERRHRYTGHLHTKSEALFAVPREIADLQAELVNTVLDGDALLVDFFEATRGGSDLKAVGPAYMRWLLDLEIPEQPPAVAAYLRKARDATTKRIYGGDPDGAAGVAEGTALLPVLREPAHKMSVFVGMKAFMRETGDAASMVVLRDGQRQGDCRPALRRMAAKLTEMLVAAR